MDEATSLLIEGLQSIEDSVGATITWPAAQGQVYPCAGGAELGGKILGMGGYRTTAQVRIVVRTAVLQEGNFPRERQTVIYTASDEADPHTLRVASVNSFRGAFLVLDCDDPSQGT